MKMIFLALAIITGVFVGKQAIADTKYEAESATLSGGANTNTNHTGYSGAGFVEGFINNTTAQVSFAITGATGGSYTITLHYSAGGGTSTNTGLYVNGTKIKNISCPATTNWDTWADETETVSLITGNNTIAYKAETSSGNCINLDYVITVGGTDACAGIQGGGGGLIGTTFGLNPPYTTGSEYCKATDGNINTYYDFSQGNSGYTGLDLGSAKVIKKIKFYPRTNFADRMIGGKFQGSTNASTYTDLYTITTSPPLQWNEATISNTTGYRYVRYLTPNNGWGNIAEMEFYETPTTYLLTLSTDGHGTTSPAGIVTVNSGAATPIAALPSAGYLFSSWSVTSGSATIASTTTASTTVTLSSGNASVQAQFTAHAPTDFSVSPSSITEHLPANTVVGTFSAQDVDFNSTFTFSLVSGAGSADNGSFGVISGNQLVTTSSFDYATKSSYAIRIRCIDNTGLQLEKTFTINVLSSGSITNPVPTPAAGSMLPGASVTVSWTTVAGATSYKLQMGSSVGGQNLYNGTAGTATSAAVTGLPIDGSTIYVRLTTTDGNGPHIYDFTYIANSPGLVYVYPKDCGPGQNMKVDGRIKCQSLLIQNWLLSQKAAPDYVFEKNYNLSSLSRIEKYINENGHLPEVPSAKELENNGVDMIQLNFTLLKKIEEMTLHMIRQEKEIENLKKARDAVK